MLFFNFITEHILAVIAVIVTVVFIYHYIIEKEHGVKLTKKYRKNILESQSKIFLNATGHLISGDKNMAIKEFLSAVDLNRETIDTYFALGELFRSNGQIEKAINVHRSLIARENISESTRLNALKELAIDFDKGGFINKAIDTYKDVLKINRDQHEVIQSLCRIYEDIEDWDMAYSYRIMLSKIAHENQSETISHILVEKAKKHFEAGDYKSCTEDLDDAFRFAPSISAKILQIKLYLVKEKLEDAKTILLELLNENPMFASFIFESLEDNKIKDPVTRDNFIKKLSYLKEVFLDIEDKVVISSPSYVLSQVRLLKKNGHMEQAFEVLKRWMDEHPSQRDVLKVEYIKLLIETGKEKLALTETTSFLDNLNRSLTKHFCSQCGFNSDDIFWRCPQCHSWETIQFRWKV
ncbi:MAG: hypothetical protein N4A33_02590 [Bacteriovoracaceae bacterium]|jgi:lipopolysaccharide biosynthesis regulator YciM|nr:hypothetical protein [Bacteriovoracaceae bacterium]